MLSKFELMSLKTIEDLLNSFFSLEEKRTGFSFKITHSDQIIVDCGDLGKFTIPLKAFPNIYSTLLWDVLASQKGTSVLKNKIVYNKYYLIHKVESDTVLVAREILEKIPSLYRAEDRGTLLQPVFSNLTLETLIEFCNQCFQMSEFLLDPEAYEKLDGPMQDGISYLAAYYSRWNVVIWRTETEDYVLWRFGKPLYSRKLDISNVRIIPDTVKSMPPKLLSYRFESDHKEGSSYDSRNTEAEL